MTNLEASIYCVNRKCKTLNPFHSEFCCKCYTPIVKRYLWTLGEETGVHKIGDLIGDRYLLKQDKVLLDTKPGIIPKFPEDIPPELEIYLKLFPYRLHLPQIYGYINTKEPIWLLEYSSISTNQDGELIHPQLFPCLKEVWQELSPLRQLNLLWQIIQLWQPLSAHKVVSSLLNQDLLRVNSSVIQLLELQSDGEDSPGLEKLGELWLNWSKNCSETIAEFLNNLALCLQKGLITQPDKILDILDQAIYKYSSNSFHRQYKIITATHTGKKRRQNEDACYPFPKNLKTVSDGIDTLTILCDGLGGQEGGEIASQLAIKIIKRELTNYYIKQTVVQNQNNAWTPLMDAQQILNAIHQANNQINQRNNQEKRTKLARMGTTAVMSLAIDHEMYLSHVGDSRIYWITEQNCYQVTVDDDLASREVRLGYAFYRDIIRYPQTGALLQALGINDSQHLHPHIQRLILDQDCVFLLCSDGLSDFDRVEQYWKRDILPILKGEINLVQAAKNLLNIGIKKNGHDNITFALVYCQIKSKGNKSPTILSWDEIQPIFPDLPTVEEIPKEEKKEEQNQSNKSKMVVHLSLVGLILLASGIFCVTQWESIKNYFNSSDKPSQLQFK
jgi:protein phosphatase